MKKQHVQLQSDEREQLQVLLRTPSTSVQVWQRAQGLLALDAGQTLQRVAQDLDVCYLTVSQWRDRYRQDGLAMLLDKARSGRPPRIDGLQRAKITALACSTPPPGYARWSVRLLAAKVVELGLVESISHDSVHRILKKNELQPHLKKTWCLGELNSHFIARMEQILWLYSLPHDPHHPVLCFDERPCYLIGEAVAPLNAQPGRVSREHYSYTRNGSCCLLAAIEPLTGRRLAHLQKQRTKREYALFLRDLCAQYPQAHTIRLVQDNLNTHCKSALYETFEPKEAFALSQRLEFFYTPKSASWLNMIEIEFSALSRQCLNRRIPSLEMMEREVLAWVQERQDKAIQIHWQFSIQNARDTFHNAYAELTLKHNPLP